MSEGGESGCSIANKYRFFYPCTTTPIEPGLNRGQYLLTGKNEVCWLQRDRP